jgi:meiotic recombination protein SPO11
MITVQSIPYLAPSVDPCMQGKGYPDLATRQLVKNLSDKLPSTYVPSQIKHFQLIIMLFISIPIVVLVDGDAYGLDIVSVYKFGSVALRHEASKLAAPRVECIGIWASELASQVPSHSVGP